MSSKEIRPGAMAFSRTGTAENPAFSGGKGVTTTEGEEKKPATGRNLRRNLILTGTAVVGVGVVAIGVQHYPLNDIEFSPPGIVRSVQGIPSTFGKDIDALFNLLRPKVSDTTPTPVDKAFPYTLDASSFVSITQEQAIEKMKNTNIADVENFTVKMFLPFDKETLDASPNLKYDQVQSAIIPPYLDETLKKRLEGVKNSVQIDGLLDGKIIKWSLPSSGKLRVSSIAGQKKGNGSDAFIPSYSSASIDFQDKNGRQIRIIIIVLGGEPLFDLSKASWEGKGVDIEFNQSIFKISKNNAIGGQAVSGVKGQITINAFYMLENPPTSIPNFTVPKLPMPLKIDFLNEIIVE